MGDNRLTVILPMGPIGKGRPRTGRYGNHYTPSKTRDWEAEAAQLIAKAIKEARYQAPAKRKPVRVEIFAVFPCGIKDRLDSHHVARPDIDNIAKACLDAMVKGGLLQDDSQVAELSITKRYDIELHHVLNPFGRTVITLEPL